MTYSVAHMSTSRKHPTLARFISIFLSSLFTGTRHDSLWAGHSQVIDLLRELITAKSIHSKYMDTKVAHNTAQRFNTEVRWVPRVDGTLQSSSVGYLFIAVSAQRRICLIKMQLNSASPAIFMSIPCFVFTLSTVLREGTGERNSGPAAGADSGERTIHGS